MEDNQSNARKTEDLFYFKRLPNGSLDKYAFRYSSITELLKETINLSQNPRLAFNLHDSEQIFAKQVQRIIPEVLKKIQRKKQ